MSLNLNVIMLILVANEALVSTNPLFKPIEIFNYSEYNLTVQVEYIPPIFCDPINVNVSAKSNWISYRTRLFCLIDNIGVVGNDTMFFWSPSSPSPYSHFTVFVEDGKLQIHRPPVRIPKSRIFDEGLHDRVLKNMKLKG